MRGGEVDVEVLLRGVETLNEVYEMPGVTGRVAACRSRYTDVGESLVVLESKVARLTRELDRMNRGDWEGEEDEDEEDDGGVADEIEVEVTDEDLRREEEEVRELERKKRQLEDRVSGMERDLGGLLR